MEDGGEVKSVAAASPTPGAGAATNSRSEAVSALFDGVFDADAVKKTDNIVRFEQRIEANQWDTDAWSSLINETKNQDINTVRCYFGKFLQQFPTSGRTWKIYLTREMQEGNLGLVDKAFKVLFSSECLNVDLYKSYLQYMKDKRLARDTMRKAYDYVLGAIGMDIDATSIWQDYIEFLRSWETSNTFEESQKMMALRKVFQDAVGNPVDGVEQFWKEFDQYENQLNKITAKKFLSDRNFAYQAARGALRERRARMEGLNRNMLATPFRGTAKERQQLSQWRAYIAWEQGNPLKLDKREDVHKRVIFAYRQALLNFCHSAQLWYEFCTYMADQGLNAAVEYDKGVAAVPDSLLLAFAYADYEEVRKNYGKATSVYERVLACEDVPDKTLAYVQYMKFKRRTEGLSEARKIFKRARSEKDRVQYHVFVSSALMEYHCDKKVEVAEKIFRFGLENPRQNFSGDLNYLLDYIDFLSHLTEDNNTRVLFERVLSTVAKEDQVIIWQKFLQFEADYGDLKSVLSAEQRCREALSGAGVDPVCYAVQRYQYEDLLPCSRPELDYMRFHDAFPTNQPVAKRDEANAVAAQDMSLVTPDLSQMVAFNPEDGASMSSNAPTAVKDLLRLLPPVTSFTGPYVNIQMLLDFMHVQDNLPALAPPSATSTGPADDDGRGVKRGQGGSDSEDDEPGLARPVRAGARPNIFQKRMRQQLVT